MIIKAQYANKESHIIINLYKSYRIIFGFIPLINLTINLIPMI